MNALMELLSRGEYVSWKLPENTHIVLSSNPDNGDYQVSSLDPAQRNRFVSFNMKFDLQNWAKWAEQAGIESRIINFCLLYPEVFDNPNDTGITPRSMVTFANALSGIEDFSAEKNMSLINLIAEGCFESQDNVIGKFFTMFINNKLDRLVNPHEMLTGDWKTVQKKLIDSIYDREDEIRADISSVMTVRFINYIETYITKNKGESKVVMKRVIELVESDKTLLTVDLVFKMIKDLTSKYPQRFNDLLLNAAIRKQIMS